MKVVECSFLIGAAAPRDFPATELPEVTFMGRSNVGKSSLLNALVGQRRLAHTGSTPGRTQQVNFFRINRACLFVDLPGYGFARVSRAVRAAWRDLVEAYLDRPVSARLAVLIVDSRHEPTEPDREMRRWLEHRGFPYVVAATKADKVSSNERQRLWPRHLTEIRRPELLIPCSARTREGIPSLWAAIDRMLNEAKSKN